MQRQGLKRAEEGLTLPEVAPRTTQDHMASLRGGERNRDECTIWG